LNAFPIKIKITDFFFALFLNKETLNPQQSPHVVDLIFLLNPQQIKKNQIKVGKLDVFFFN
jgi:hypothetical protein